MSIINLNQLIQGQNSSASYQNDNSLLNEVNKRSEKYTHLIETYDKYIEDTVNFKSRMRWVAFWLFIGIFIIVLCFTIGAIQTFSQNPSIKGENIVPLITAGATLISAIIILPEKIVGFIFNGEEDKYIVNLIKNTQRFDKK